MMYFFVRLIAHVKAKCLQIIAHKLGENKLKYTVVSFYV